MINIHDSIDEEIVFSVVWNISSDFLRDDSPFECQLYITRKKMYLFQLYKEERFLEHRIVLMEALGGVTLKDSTGFSGPHCIFLDISYKNPAGTAIRLSFDNTEEGRNLSKKIFVAVSKALK